MSRLPPREPPGYASTFANVRQAGKANLRRLGERQIDEAITAAMWDSVEQEGPTGEPARRAREYQEEDRHLGSR